MSAGLRPLEAPAFHAGEQALQDRVGVRERMGEIGPMVLRDHMPDQHRELFEKLPTLLLGALDADGQPWATMVAGPPGFVYTPDARSMQVAVPPDAADPALAQLAPGTPVGVLGLEPHTRRRNRMNGRVAAFGAQGLAVDVVQSFGNCPKYIQARAPGLREVVTPPAPPQALGPQLDAAALALIARSDTLFIASASAARPGAARNEGVDVSHRGGEPGFVHIAHREEGGVVLSVPDYPGNLFFNTLGNLALHPLAGLLWVDYDGGGLLHVAARSELLWDDASRAPWPGAQRVLRLQVLGGVWRANALPWRWTAAQAAPQFGVLRARAAG
ncbi:pyridoxamine 5'-phosphate oxidase [Acidovorax sp. Leaf76]|uniref:pyridoxamine 5'-phosphate oxidase family protein n=1 Tax=unclassified Acidovorax TaxID=2684926 RepID=UPI0006F6766E|nr:MULTISPECIES: pyridoxamine 5'-phosphate oxidase family protein [unclassified Acidovorax]KQO26899.1 pyridoxamine 5'-phosphate oxidase [Acidovorax sp. Leaf76]KQO40667.1 pyridoxamine 5'-phosphate oxidase [Acidovorax sp. Leaf84]KQS42812.1 pyridoxamine 5'-phosphate oxidase [Acidovorax sp. Leaf191]